ncbi:MAG: hypothetical protein LBF60_04435 [Treponema sp.]|jgi:hypothetical protein|nr:hypothetical protein [Treponema sp.]
MYATRLIVPFVRQVFKGYGMRPHIGVRLHVKKEGASINLQRPNSNDATSPINRSTSVAPCGGLCSRCVDGRRGCREIFKASFRGRELIYPGPFGGVTAGWGGGGYPASYSHLNIQGYAHYGWDRKIKMSLPVFTGVLGSTEITRKNYAHFAVGAAISGVTIVCGEILRR